MKLVSLWERGSRFPSFLFRTGLVFCFYGIFLRLVQLFFFSFHNSGVTELGNCTRCKFLVEYRGNEVRKVWLFISQKKRIVFVIGDFCWLK